MESQAVATATNEIDDIRRRMAQIRRELHEDVEEVVAGAGAVADWRRYVRMYPWAAVGLAATLGYLIVPKRRRNVPRDVARKADVAEVREVIEQVREPEPRAKPRAKSILGAGLAMLTPLAWRAAQNYAMGYLEQWIAQQQQQYMASSGPPPSGSQSTGWPGGTPPPPGAAKSPSPPPSASPWPGGPRRPGGPAA